ncbi:MAG: hypothetical protein ACM3NQ_19955 [Bacteroidales bacterium]
MSKELSKQAGYQQLGCSLRGWPQAESDYVAKLARAGFEDVSIEPTRVYRVEDAREFLSGHGFDVDTIAPLVDGRFFSGFIRARKPVA